MTVLENRSVPSYNIIFLFIFLSLSFALGISFLVEIGADVKPCFLCFLQRINTGLIILLACVGIRSNSKQLFALLIGISSLLLMGVTLYHLGVQWGFLTDRCTVNVPSDYNNFLSSLKNSQSPCSRIYSFLKVPLPGWLFLISANCFVAVLFTHIQKEKNSAFKPF